MIIVIVMQKHFFLVATNYIWKVIFPALLFTVNKKRSSAWWRFQNLWATTAAKPSTGHHVSFQPQPAEREEMHFPTMQSASSSRVRFSLWKSQHFQKSLLALRLSLPLRMRVLKLGRRGKIGNIWRLPHNQPCQSAALQRNTVSLRVSSLPLWCSLSIRPHTAAENTQERDGWSNHSGK